MNLFDTPTNREQTSCEKWDLRKEVFKQSDVLPLWVADMDFEVANVIKQALLTRVNHGIFGYTFPDPLLYTSISSWLLKRHQWDVSEEEIILNNTVISSMNLLLQLLSQPGDKIAMFSPIYFPIFETTERLGRQPLFVPLSNQNAHYEIDFKQLEQTFESEKPKIFILCNPHNPGGRVWMVEELQQLLALCEKYQIAIISDDIHHDLVFPPAKYTPIASLTDTYKEQIFTLAAPTKSFNFPGLKAAFLVVHQQEMRERFLAERKKLNYPSMNILAIEAMSAAYQQGEAWLDELIPYLKENHRLLEAGLENTLFDCFSPEGTFLMWVSYGRTKCNEAEMKGLLIQAGLGCQMGSQFGNAGEGYFRINVGTQAKQTQKAVQILQQLSAKLLEQHQPD